MDISEYRCVNDNIDDCSEGVNCDKIIKNNLGSFCKEINNLDNMLRIKIVLLEDDIIWLKDILKKTIECSKTCRV